MSFLQAVLTMVKFMTLVKAFLSMMDAIHGACIICVLQVQGWLGLPSSTPSCTKCIPGCPS